MFPRIFIAHPLSVQYSLCFLRKYVIVPFIQNADLWVVSNWGHFHNSRIRICNSIFSKKNWERCYLLSNKFKITDSYVTSVEAFFRNNFSFFFTRYCAYTINCLPAIASIPILRFLYSSGYTHKFSFIREKRRKSDPCLARTCRA